MTWHVLDASSIWVKEFAAALSQRAPVMAWAPEMRWLGGLESWQRDEFLSNPQLVLRRFPLQRGYSRPFVANLARFEEGLLRALRRADAEGGCGPLICTTPFYAPVAERWTGPVVYYQTDLTVGYEGVNPEQVMSLDRRLCGVAAAVCPNSRRIAQYFIRAAGCPPEKISVIPNATRAANVFAVCPRGPAPLPPDIADLPRPIAGVIGNLAGNMDWVFIRDLIARTPEMSWVFVGPVTIAIECEEQARGRKRVMALGGRVRFTGSRAYGELRSYARAFDVALLPYKKREPTYSGSSTRFYEHLAACRPMIATLGFNELLRFEPLLRLVATPEEGADELRTLRRVQFDDGLQQARWQASKSGTWEKRAERMMQALDSATASPAERRISSVA
ncbi:MAG: hypothetical protein NVSMB31_05080 [Vulcanimicrobiaceae bacterium]